MSITFLPSANVGQSTNVDYPNLLYVNPLNGSDANSGLNINAPVATLGKAWSIASVATLPTVIYLSPAIYTTDVLVQDNVSPIAIIGMDATFGQSVIFTGSVTIKSASIRIDSVTFNNTITVNPNGAGTDNVGFVNCTINQGLNNLNTGLVTLNNCVFANSPEQVISFTPNPNGTMQVNNTLLSGTWEIFGNLNLLGCDSYVTGISLQFSGGTSFVSNCVLFDNGNNNVILQLNGRLNVINTICKTETGLGGLQIDGGTYYFQNVQYNLDVSTVDGTPTTNTVANSQNLNLLKPLLPQSGGTGTGAVPTVGQTLIGNTATGVFAPAKIVAGQNVTITNATSSGQYTIGAGALSASITNWDIATVYPSGSGVLYNNVPYVANADIPANTPFGIGRTGKTWLPLDAYANGLSFKNYTVASSGISLPSTLFAENMAINLNSTTNGTYTVGVPTTGPAYYGHTREWFIVNTSGSGVTYQLTATSSSTTLFSGQAIRCCYTGSQFVFTNDNPFVPGGQSSGEGWGSYIPTITASTTNPSKPNTTIVNTGFYTVNNKTLFLNCAMSWENQASAVTGSGVYTISMPTGMQINTTISVKAPTLTDQFPSTGNILGTGMMISTTGALGVGGAGVSWLVAEVEAYSPTQLRVYVRSPEGSTSTWKSTDTNTAKISATWMLKFTAVIPIS